MVRRSTRRKQATEFSIPQLPVQNIVNPYPPVEILDLQQLEDIHDASMRILEEIGLLIENDRAKALMLEHGALLDTKTGYVLMDRGLVLELISTVPGKFKLHARNPKFDTVFGGNHINFTMVASAPNCSDLDRGRRTGNYADFCDFLRLGQFFNIIKDRKSVV